MLLAACKNHQPDQAKTTVPSADTTSASFFPVTDFIGGQLKIIDSLKPPVTKEITINKKATVSATTDDELRASAQAFLKPDINDPGIKSFYTETSIADQSIPSVTLIFTTTHTELPLKTINVYIKPDPVLNDKVSAVFMEKSWASNDTLISQKLYWKTDHNFQITTEKKIGDKVLPQQQVKFIWDPTD